MKKKIGQHFIALKKTLQKVVFRFVEREFRRLVFETFVEVFIPIVREILWLRLPLFAI